MGGKHEDAFFCVWTVHHDCDDHPAGARTQRGRLGNLLFMGMFFHVEHHLYPRVPTCRLPRLAARLDRIAPELTSRRIF